MTTPNKQKVEANRLIEKMSKDMRAAFKSAISAASSNIDFGQLVQALSNNDIERAIRLAKVDAAALSVFAESVRSAYIAGGSLAAASGPALLFGRFSFDGRHARAIDWVDLNVGTLIEGITDETLKSVRSVIADGLRNNRPPTSLARDITGRTVGRRRVGGFLGLNSQQTDRLLRVRSILSDPQRIKEYFIKDRETGRMRPRYKSTDRRYDRAVRNAIERGRAISGKELDDMIEAAKNKALGNRGRTIAKDQSRQAVAAGRDEGFRQMNEREDISGVTKRWQHNLSENPREDHVEMSGTTINIDEKFVFPDGVQMDHSHDAAGGAEHNIGCRCITIYRVQVPKR